MASVFSQETPVYTRTFRNFLRQMEWVGCRARVPHRRDGESSISGVLNIEYRMGQLHLGPGGGSRKFTASKPGPRSGVTLPRNISTRKGVCRVRGSKTDICVPAGGPLRELRDTTAKQ